MPNLIALYRLQQTDKHLKEISQELELLKNLETESSELRGAEAALLKLHSQKREAERLQKDADLKLASLEAEKKRVEDKLYSGKVTNSKELSGLQRDLEQLLQQRGKLDEQVLRGMDTLETLNRELQKEEKIVPEIRERHEKEIRDREERRETLSRQLEELKTRRENFAQSLDELLLEQYVGLKERKGGVAVAKLQRNSCSACYMIVPAGTIQKVRALELEYCSSCGRILYTDKEL